MELLKDKLFNGISLEIINDGYIKSDSYYSIIIKVGDDRWVSKFRDLNILQKTKNYL